MSDNLSVERLRIKLIRGRLEAWKRCFETDDLTKPEIVRSNLNDLYLILNEFLAALGEP